MSANIVADIKNIQRHNYNHIALTQIQQHPHYLSFVLYPTQLFHVDNSPAKMDCSLGNLSCRCRNYLQIKLHATLQLNSSRPSFEIDPNFKHILPPIICVRPDTQLIPVENFQADRYLNLPISTYVTKISQIILQIQRY